MGNQTIQKPKTPVTGEEIEKAVNLIYLLDGDKLNKKDLEWPIEIILQFIRENQIFFIRQKGTTVNPSILKLFFDPAQTKSIGEAFKILIKQLQSLDKKSISSVKTSSILKLTYLSNFMLFMSNQRLKLMFEGLQKRRDIDESLKEMIQKLKGSKKSLNQISFFQSMSLESKYEAEKICRDVLISLIKARYQMINHSRQSLKKIWFFQYSLFMMMTKIYYCTPVKEQTQIIRTLRMAENIKIAIYFIAAGSNNYFPVIYETASLFLYTLLCSPHIHLPKILNFPSHVFQQLPLISTKYLYDFAISTILFTLKFTFQGNKKLARFQFNRMLSLKLILKILKLHPTENSLITYYLEELCCQVKRQEIQRVYMHQIVCEYSKNSELKSQILKKFIEKGNIPFKINLSQDSITLTTAEVMKELNEKQFSFEYEYATNQEKYLFSMIFFRPLLINYNEKSLWKQLIEKILKDRRQIEKKEQVNRQ